MSPMKETYHPAVADFVIPQEERLCCLGTRFSLLPSFVTSLGFYLRILGSVGK